MSLTPTQKATAQAIVNIFETGRVHGDYGQVTLLAGDTGHLTPLVKMHTLGSTFVPSGFHAGGLRYHGMAPLVSHAAALGLIEAVAYQQLECFEAAVTFARAEGIVPAPEASHADGPFVVVSSTTV